MKSVGGIFRKCTASTQENKNTANKNCISIAFTKAVAKRTMSTSRKKSKQETERVCTTGDKLNLEISYVKDIEIIAFGYAYESFKASKKLKGTVVRSTPRSLDVITNTNAFVDHVTAHCSASCTVSDSEHEHDHTTRSTRLDLPAGTLLSFKRLLPKKGSNEVVRYRGVNFLSGGVGVIFTGTIYSGFNDDNSSKKTKKNNRSSKKSRRSKRSTK